MTYITGTLLGDLRACSTPGSLIAQAADAIESYEKTMAVMGEIPLPRENNTTMRHMADQFLRLMGLTGAYNDWLANGGGLPAHPPAQPQGEKVAAPQAEAVGFKIIAGLSEALAHASGEDTGAREFPPQPEGGTAERYLEALNAIIDRGPERDPKWTGMTAKDIALFALQPEKTK